MVEKHVYEDICCIGEDHDHTVQQQHQVELVRAEHNHPVVEIGLFVDCLVDETSSDKD